MGLSRAGMRRDGEGHAVMFQRPFHEHGMEILDAQQFEGAARLIGQGDLGHPRQGENGAQDLGARHFARDQKDADFRKTFQLHGIPLPQGA